MAMELATSLRSDAISILADMPEQSRSDYDSLVSALATRFEPKDMASLYMSQIRSRMRKKSESIPELAQSIKKLARHALPASAPEVREWLALQYFIEALNDEFMEFSVSHRKPQTVDEAMKIAVEVEAFQLCRKRRHGKDQVRMQREQSPVRNETKKEKSFQFRGIQA